MTIKHLFPDAWPTLNLDFANELALDPRITFSRSSVGTYVDKNGIVQYAAEEEPRFDYDPETGESLGLLIEEFRTNDTYPSTFDGTTGTWRYTNYVTPNQTTAPDGTNTGALLDFEMVGASGNLNFDSNTPQVSGTRSFSFWCKTASPGAGTRMKLDLVNWTFSNGDAGTRVYTLDFDTGSPISKTDDYEVQAYPNGWYRCMISNVSQGGYLSFRINKNPQNWYIWGMQSEEGTFPTSYIPTNGAPVDRDADLGVASVSLTATTFSHAVKWDGPFIEGKRNIVYLDVNGRATKAALKVCEANIAPDRKIEAWMDTRYNSGANGGFPTLRINFSDYKYAYHIASSFDSTTGIFRLTDGDQTLNNSGKPESNGIPFTRVVFGQDGFTGHIARYAFYSQALNNDQLEALTS